MGASISVTLVDLLLFSCRDRARDSEPAQLIRGRRNPTPAGRPSEAGFEDGEYEDFMTGFVVNDSSVWARPVGVAVAHDGALLVSEDGNGTIWRVSYRGGP
jgi:glucose/arabinose dehydrogenase